MRVRVSPPSENVFGEINITGSKSESNRLLILQALFPGIQIENLSNSDDTQVLQKALSSGEKEIDIHHAGTAMRFLTAFYASREGREVVLTGSKRMQERPVAILVEALRQLGAEIEYLKNEGFPPLKINGRRLQKNQVEVQANISSQYISALMLIAPALPNGLRIQLQGKTTSVPYIEMTLNLMKKCGFEGFFKDSLISIEPAEENPPVTLTVESDWSSASYFYSMVALAKEAEITLESYKEDSHQGDRTVAKIFQKLGVKTSFLDGKLLLKKQKENSKKPKSLELDLSNSPDLAQTVAVTCFGLGIKCNLTGLHTLRIKETDRLQALKNEIEKLGGQVEITSDSLQLAASEGFHEQVQIETYNDHRMALAFAPLALKTPLEILDAAVVSKSFPGFWENLENLSFSVEKSAID